MAVFVASPADLGTIMSARPFMWKIGVSLLAGVPQVYGGSWFKSGNQVTVGMKAPILYLVCMAV